MKSFRGRLLVLVTLGLLGLGAGLAFSASTNAGDPGGFAVYPEYDSLAELRTAADLVIRGRVVGEGEPYLDSGAPMAGDATPMAGAVPMRVFDVAAESDGNSGTGSADLIQVAVTDADVLGISGDARLADGDDVYLFLEELDNSLFEVAQVKPDRFFVVVGGHQGVFREAGDDRWRQDQDPHMMAEGPGEPTVEGRAALVATAAELRRQLADG